MAASPYEQLEQEFRRLHAFRGALSLLRWDAAVMMPRGSAEVRGEQLAALDTECHAVLSSPKVQRLIERAEASAQSLDDWERANLREMRRQRDHAMATPPSLVARLAKATARAEVQWQVAHQENNFAAFAPHLDEVVRLTRDKAALLGQALNLAPYDALLDQYSPGIKAADLDAMSKVLSRRLPSLIREAIELQAATPLLPLTGKFSGGRQRALATEVLRALGYPFDQGRLDESAQPFTEGVPGDIRITTRFVNSDPFAGLLGAIHEAGHAMYELGLPQRWRDQPVGRDSGKALEQSQSLLLEMIVARSRPFVHYLKPLLEKHYGVSGPEWSEENIYRHLTNVRRGVLRVEADELTYPVHILLRQELETELLSGQLLVKDLPEAWNEGMQARLGIRPESDTVGCLQDIQWAVGSFGYFPSHLVGTLVAVQLWEKIRADVDAVEAEVAAGRYAAVFGWLRENVHSWGAKVPIQELLRDATGKPLSAAPAVRYLDAKYLESATTEAAA
jgi:carboxypeptidase Taq